MIAQVIATLAFCLLLFTPSAHASDINSAVIGHRGLGEGHAPEPENSIWALQDALKEGASAVEFDVQLSKDGELILAHDVKLNRMTNGVGCLVDYNFGDLRKLRLRDGTGKIQTQTMGTFKEALEAIRPFDNPARRRLADIHIKVYDGFKGDWAGPFNGCPKTQYITLTEKTLAAVRQMGLVDRVVFTSFDERVLKLIRNLEPTAKVGLLADFRLKNALQRAITGHYDAVAFQFKHVTAEEVKTAHEHGIEAYIWSPRTVADMEKLFAVDQVDAVITDDLPNALQACKKSCYTTSP